MPATVSKLLTATKVVLGACKVPKNKNPRAIFSLRGFCGLLIKQIESFLSARKIPNNNIAVGKRVYFIGIPLHHFFSLL